MCVCVCVCKCKCKCVFLCHSDSNAPTTAPTEDLGSGAQQTSCTCMHGAKLAYGMREVAFQILACSSGIRCLNVLRV